MVRLNSGKKSETLAFLDCLIGYLSVALLESVHQSGVSSLASGVLGFNQIAVATGNQVNTNVIIK